MQIELTKELKSAITEIESFIDKRKQIDAAIVRNAESIKSAKAEYEAAEAALVSAEVELAIATTQADSLSREKIVTQVKKQADVKRGDLERAQRITVALHGSARDADSAIEESKSMLQVEINIFANEIVAQFETELIDSIQPLISTLGLAAVLRRSLISTGLSEVVNDTIIPSPTAPGAPLLRDGQLLQRSGGYLPIASIDHPDAAAIDDALAPLQKIRIAVSAHRPFNPTVVAPYVKKGYTISTGNERPQPEKPPQKSTWFPGRGANGSRTKLVEPQELNLGPAMVDASADSFDRDLEISDAIAEAQGR